MLVIFSEKNTPRLQYILQILFDTVDCPYTITTDSTYFLQYEGAKINYSEKAIALQELWLLPVEILFENDLRDQKIECFEWQGKTAFYKTMEGDYEFDVLAASFYLITRYEEYLPHRKDSYGRYAYENSLAFRQNFLNIPLVNVWFNHLYALLQSRFPSLYLKHSQFSFLPTYDIDIAWSYFEKGALRNIGGIIKSVISIDWKLLKERLSVLLGFSNDPFDVYEWLDHLHHQYRLHPIYFILLAQQTRRFDKNIPPQNDKFKRLIKKLSTMYRVGIHPSWQSGDGDHLLKQEKNLLQAIIGQPVHQSRQHYVRFQLPATYQKLIDNGITNDFSMGYGSINGFRASYTLPYKWYNLSQEKVTELTIHPFCYMEANSIFEQQYTPQQAFTELQHYYNITKQVNGTFITIFHNHLLTLQPQQIGWRKIYEQFLNDHFLKP